ncbi:MAG: FliH/SctL family protein [Hydrogenoanaerobacterium sp.]
MPKVVQSGNISLSDDVFMVHEQAPVHAVKLSDEGGIAKYGEDVIYDYESPEAQQLITENAAQHAKKVIEAAIAEGNIKRRDIIMQAEEEAVIIKQKAYNDGLEEGMNTKKTEIDDAINGIELAISKMEGEQAGFIAEYEENLRWLALEIAARILNKRIENDDTEMEALVKAAVNSVKNAEWIRVEIAETMTGLIDKVTQVLKQSDNTKVKVMGVTEPVGTCIVDTPEGRTDASVYTQLANLKEYFKNT